SAAERLLSELAAERLDASDVAESMFAAAALVLDTPGADAVKVLHGLRVATRSLRDGPVDQVQARVRTSLLIARADSRLRAHDLPFRLAYDQLHFVAVQAGGSSALRRELGAAGPERMAELAVATLEAFAHSLPSVALPDATRQRCLDLGRDLLTAY